MITAWQREAVSAWLKEQGARAWSLDEDGATASHVQDEHGNVSEPTRTEARRLKAGAKEILDALRNVK